MRLAAALAVALAAGIAQAEAPQDFVYRASLVAAPGLNVVTLDEAVYRAAQTANLSDLRIFNGKGEALPLAPLPMPAVEPGPAHDLRMVPLPAQAPARDRLLADFALRIEKQGARSVIELTSGAPPPAAAAEIGGYLLDLRPLRDANGDLAVRFAADAPDFAGQIEILGSEDLYAWRRIAGGALVRNRQLGDTIERNTFALTKVTPFVRVTWTDAQPPRLEGARFVERGAPPTLPRTTLAVARADSPNSWFVEVPIGLPIVRLTVRAPRDNTAARVRIFRYDERETRPRTRHGLRAHRVPEHWIAEGDTREVFRVFRDGQWIESAPFALSARTTQLRIDAIDGAGFGDVLPIVEAEWLPQRYVFAASAPPPYLLAVGSDASELKDGPALNVRSVLPQDDAAGSRLPVAQLAALTTPPPSAPERAQRIAREASWSRYVLWGVLGAGVLALALMAWRLASQMKRAPRETPNADPGGSG